MSRLYTDGKLVLDKEKTMICRELSKSKRNLYLRRLALEDSGLTGYAGLRWTVRWSYHQGLGPRTRWISVGNGGWQARYRIFSRISNAK